MLDGFARLLLCSLFFATHAVSASERAPFSFAGESIPAGETRSWHVAPGDGLPAIPVSVFHGTLDGPVVTLSAGIHGDEFPAITALQREAEAWSARFEAARHDGTTADAAALDALLREAEALEVRPPKGAGEEASSS